jgi:hypothetical protein
MTSPATATIGSVDDLHAEASRQTGLDDFGDPAYRTALEVLLDSFVREAGLTEEGVERTRGMLTTVLATRLRLVQARKDAPAAADAVIRRPVFVTGLPRTGTTALHRLLCVDPRTQGLEHWLSEDPQPRPPRESWDSHPGHRRTAEELAARNAASPEMKGMHFMAADMVEECWRAERLSFLSIAFQNTAHLPTYASWLAQQDLRPAYAAHRQMLQVIGLGDPDRRWVLKSPSHLFGLDALMATYPDALVIQTHRDPRTIVASVSSLNHHASAGTSTVFDAETVGRDLLDLWARGARTFADARRRHDPQQFADVAYEDFVADAPGVVASLYDSFGLEFDDDLRAAVTASHEASRTSERRPVHRYALSDFGLTEADVDAAFGTPVGTGS